MSVLDIDLTSFEEQDAALDAEFSGSEILTGFNIAAAILMADGEISRDVGLRLHELAAQITRARKQDEISNQRNN